MQRKIALLTLFTFIVVCAGFSQMKDKSKRPSPPESATCDLGNGNTIKTDYSSPRMNGRKIFGELEPYGQVWRAGANEATTFVTSTDVVVGGKEVPAGSYTLFVVPNPDKWTLIINKKTGEWGIPYTYESTELGRVDMKVTKLDSPVEDFTISYLQAGKGCTLQMKWEKTAASVEIKAQ